MTHAFPSLDLPPELRNAVYRHALVKSGRLQVQVHSVKTRQVGPPCWGLHILMWDRWLDKIDLPPALNLLLSRPQLYKEARDILFAENTIHFLSICDLNASAQKYPLVGNIKHAALVLDAVCMDEPMYNVSTLHKRLEIPREAFSKLVQLRDLEISITDPRKHAIPYLFLPSNISRPRSPYDARWRLRLEEREMEAFLREIAQLVPSQAAAESARCLFIDDDSKSHLSLRNLLSTAKLPERLVKEALSTRTTIIDLG